MIVNEGCRRQIVLGALIWRRLFRSRKRLGKGSEFGGHLLVCFGQHNVLSGDAARLQSDILHIGDRL